MSTLTPAAKARRKRQVKAALWTASLLGAVGTIVSGTGASFTSSATTTIEGSASQVVITSDHVTADDLGPIFAGMNGGQTKEASWEAETVGSGQVVGTIHLTGPNAAFVTGTLSIGGQTVDVTDGGKVTFAAPTSTSFGAVMDLTLSNSAVQGAPFGVGIDWTLEASNG